MKSISILIITLFFINYNYAHDKNKKNHEVIESSQIITSGIKTDNIVNVSTIGMVCDFCAQAIEKVFMKRNEVNGINIDLNNQKVVIFLKKDFIIEDEIILKLFEDAGYNVEDISKSI